MMNGINCTKMGLLPLITLISLFALGTGAVNKNTKNLTLSSFEEGLDKLTLQNKPNYRLNLTVYPSKYILRMRPVLDEGFPPLKRFTSPSSVSIQVESISNTSANTITLHQRGLEIDQEHVKVTDLKTGKEFTISSQSIEVARDLYEVKLEEPFQLGDLLEIFIPYSVNLSQSDNFGIYLGHYEDPLTNQTKYLSTTKLEPYHARKVFPLFDEPWIKATFEISVGRLDGKYHSLSNMEIVDTEQDLEYEGWVWDHYSETVLMSPYLVCMIVSDFAKTSVLDEKNRAISVWAPKHDIDKDGGLYGAITGEKILNYFEKKFKMDYALPKLDAVALPQFSSGAMENFGLVTYRYGYLVWIPGENTEAERRKITQVLAHEISHQWFGNIVTCGWWSDIWLNEGFARFLQSWGMQETIPEFMIEEAFVTDATQLAMAYDQGPLSHPVKNSAESPDESTSVFDKISYEKGASLLKMMEWFLAKPVFETGIIDIYLQRMKWSSAYQYDLFEAIQDAVELHNMTHLLPAGTDIKTIMDSWTLQSGYPLLRIGITDHETISISQEKFTLNTTNKWDIDPEAEETSWWIPVKVATFNDDAEADKLPDTWIPKDTSSITYSRYGLNTSNLVMVNPDASGYYRVLYDNMLTELIKGQLLSNEYSRISSSSRSQLLDDYFNLANASYIEIEEAFEMTEYLGKEISSNVWTTVLTHLKPVLSRFTQNQGAFAAFKKFYMPRLESALTSIGLRQIAGERGINVTLRAQLLEMGCQLGMPACSEYADDLMTRWELRPETNPFPVDIQSSLYCAASEVGGSDNEHWDFILGRFHEAKKDTTQKTSLLNALACSKNITILSKLLEMSLTSLGENSIQIMSRVAMNPEGRSLAYEFVKSNLVEGHVYPNEFAGVVSTLSGYWDKEEHIEELQQFIDSNGNVLEPVKELLNTSLANIQKNIDWWNSFGSRIQLWLETQVEDWFSIV